MPKDFETMDLTNEEEVDREPVMEPVTEDLPEEESADEVIETVDETIEDEPYEPAPEDETTDGAGEEAPDINAVINERLDGLSQVIDGLLAKIDALAITVDNINKLEEARAAGPSGFFKPLDEGAKPEYTGLARIEREYR